MFKTAIILCLLLLARPAFAQGRIWPYAVSASGQAVDLVSTLRFYANGSGCREANGIVRREDASFRTGRAVLGKVAVVGVSWAMLKVARRSRSKWLIRLAEGENLAIGAIGAGTAAHNAALCGF